MILLSGNSNRLLANHISNHAGIALSEMKLTRFADGEIFCEIHQNIRGEDVFQSGTPESFNVLIKEIRSLGLNIELSNLN